MLALKNRFFTILDKLIDCIPDAMKPRGKTGFIFLIPSLALIGLLVWGVGFLLWYSFQIFDPLYLVEPGPTLANYRRLFGGLFYWKLLWRTTYVSVLVTALALLLAYPYAYLVTRIRSSLARKTLIVLSIVPFTIGVIIRAYAWLIVMGKGGLLNSFVFLITGTRIKLMYTGGAVIVGLLQIMIPIAIIEMIPAFTAVGRDMELAAENCGANRFRTFLYVLLPLSRPGITSAALVTFTLTFTSYAVPKFLGGGQFDLIGNQIYQQVFRTMNWPFAGALSLVALLVASVLIYSIFHFIGHGELRM